MKYGIGIDRFQSKLMKNQLSKIMRLIAFYLYMRQPKYFKSESELAKILNNKANLKNDIKAYMT